MMRHSVLFAASIRSPYATLVDTVYVQAAGLILLQPQCVTHLRQKYKKETMTMVGLWFSMSSVPPIPVASAVAQFSFQFYDRHFRMALKILYEQLCGACLGCFCRVLLELRSAFVAL
jgi:hypothetical protein